MNFTRKWTLVLLYFFQQKFEEIIKAFKTKLKPLKEAFYLVLFLSVSFVITIISMALCEIYPLTFGFGVSILLIMSLFTIVGVISYALTIKFLSWIENNWTLAVERADRKLRKN